MTTASARTRPTAAIGSMLALMCLAGLAGCTGAPMTTASTGLAPGLVAEINSPGAQMDRQSALSIVNQYRALRGAAPLAADPSLDAQAQALATQYASSGNAPSRPADAAALRLSAGYSNFADTFSGWRNSPADADVMAQGDARRVGFAAVYDPSSAYGTHWVMLMGR
ncbi:CAP domain-containing protein [Pelagibacterium luteolum]|uniref:Cysteine-rich secretory protein family protein n=1 Tax=Pelagibacterium luteolum TaxID=440168 RepID=A0A1G7RUR3_9HYPH|nr:CAP domain-containing protein [Pelagibacterium luteolum]SDG13600.1 Cysteine-rich secretory protein family protein [Pelagibacterium luteolum]